MDAFQELQTKYKSLLREAYELSKSDEAKSKKLYAKADELRQQLYAF